MLLPRRLRSMPSPVEALPCGSMSTTSTRWPTAARPVARLIAVVVLPTPPFWLAMAMMRPLRSDALIAPSHHDHGAARAAAEVDPALAARQAGKLGRIEEMPAPGIRQGARADQVDGALPLLQQRQIGLQPGHCFT